MTFILVLSFAAIAVVACVLYWWSARRHAVRPQPPPLVIFPINMSPDRAHVNGLDGVNGANGKNGKNGNGPPYQGDRPAARPFVAAPSRMTPANAANHANHANHANAANHVTPADQRRPVSPVGTQHDNAETVRFVRPTDMDAAVQLLPGRLEVLEGATPHREIRFMRVPGESPHVILGREIRLTPHYVGLGSPMVSRRHARLDYADNRWTIKNLSRTNPLVVNDDELFDTDVARPLADGDRLELGDVVLRFHAH